MATGMYEGVAELRLAEALAAQARLAAARSGGAQRTPEAAVAALVRLLDRAADMFAQARPAPWPRACFPGGTEVAAGAKARQGRADAGARVPGTQRGRVGAAAAAAGGPGGGDRARVLPGPVAGRHAAAVHPPGQRARRRPRARRVPRLRQALLAHQGALPALAAVPALLRCLLAPRSQRAWASRRCARWRARRTGTGWTLLRARRSRPSGLSRLWPPRAPTARQTRSPRSALALPKAGCGCPLSASCACTCCSDRRTHAPGSSHEWPTASARRRSTLP